jgi:hypothetical protein
MSAERMAVAEAIEFMPPNTGQPDRPALRFWLSSRYAALHKPSISQPFPGTRNE